MLFAIYTVQIGHSLCYAAKLGGEREILPLNLILARYPLSTLPSGRVSSLWENLGMLGRFCAEFAAGQTLASARKARLDEPQSQPDTSLRAYWPQLVTLQKH